MAAPVCFEGRALQFGLILCFPVFGAELGLFCRIGFLIIEQFSAFSRRLNPGFRFLFELIPEPLFQILNLLGPLAEHPDFFLSENVHLKILPGAPEPVAGGH